MSDPPTASLAPSFDLYAIALKLPEFWADKLRVWFAQTEAQLAIKGLTSSLTKFYYCLGTLNQADAAQIVDLIEFPPKEKPYKFL